MILSENVKIRSDMLYEKNTRYACMCVESVAGNTELLFLLLFHLFLF